jgi:hypothetical protein
MSAELAKFLLAVADPTKLQEYHNAPEQFLSCFKLTPGDHAALRSGKSGWIRVQANLADDISGLNGNHPTVLAGSHGLEIEIDLMIENQTEAHDLVAEQGIGMIVVGDGGKLFKVVA